MKSGEKGQTNMLSVLSPSAVKNGFICDFSEVFVAGASSKMSFPALKANFDRCSSRQRRTADPKEAVLVPVKQVCPHELAGNVTGSPPLRLPDVSCL